MEGRGSHPDLTSGVSLIEGDALIGLRGVSSKRGNGVAGFNEDLTDYLRTVYDRDEVPAGDDESARETITFLIVQSTLFEDLEWKGRTYSSEEVRATLRELNLID